MIGAHTQLSFTYQLHGYTNTNLYQIKNNDHYDDFTFIIRTITIHRPNPIVNIHSLSFSMELLVTLIAVQ